MPTVGSEQPIIVTVEVVVIRADGTREVIEGVSVRGNDHQS